MGGGGSCGAVTPPNRQMITTGWAACHPGGLAVAPARAAGHAGWKPVAADSRYHSRDTDRHRQPLRPHRPSEPTSLRLCGEGGWASFLEVALGGFLASWPFLPRDISGDRSCSRPPPSWPPAAPPAGRCDALPSCGRPLLLNSCRVLSFIGAIPKSIFSAINADVAKPTFCGQPVHFSMTPLYTL